MPGRVRAGREAGTVRDDGDADGWDEGVEGGKKRCVGEQGVVPFGCVQHGLCRDG